MIDVTLNARIIEGPKIGKTFVMHPKFEKLSGLDNCIVIGPRGSGKTTMLRMLTPEALDNWNPSNKKEIEIKNRIDYLAIYVPLSRILMDDLNTRFNESTRTVAEKNNIVFEVYFFNIIISILDLVYHLIKKHNKSKSDELKFISLINTVLNIPSESAYTINELYVYIDKTILNFRNSLIDGNMKLPISKSGSIISNLEPVLRVINYIFDFNPSKKYAFCLDELDVYQSEFTTEMVRNLRGTSPNIILKLSIAPIQKLLIKDIYDTPKSFHDYENIYLWPYSDLSTNKSSNEENEYFKFSEELSNKTIQSLTNSQIKIDDILGNFNYLDVFKYMKDYEGKQNIFKTFELNLKKGSDLTLNVFKYYANINPNFKKYLIKNNVDLNSTKVDRLISSQFIRKLKEIIFNRVIVTEIKDDKIILKSQKSFFQYHGKEIILKSVDGNPRYLKKLMEFLVEEIKYDKNTPQKISIQAQGRALYRISKVFIERLSSIPVNDDQIRKNVGEFIYEIGTHLSENINKANEWEGSSFYSCISFPNAQDLRKFENVFSKAVNNGALLMIGENDLGNLNTVRGKKMRLNYLLHVYFRIPIRKYYCTSYDNIIDLKKSNQFKLFE
jgi:hypothetical protein